MCLQKQCNQLLQISRSQKFRYHWLNNTPFLLQGGRLSVKPHRETSVSPAACKTSQHLVNGCGCT